jgi:hypothetical protein
VIPGWLHMEAGFVLSVWFPDWKPLRLLPASPLPTCAFPGWKGQPLASMWAVRLTPPEAAGTWARVHLGVGPAWGEGGAAIPRCGMMGASLGSLGNVAPCPPVGVGQGLGEEGWPIPLCQALEFGFLIRKTELTF